MTTLSSTSTPIALLHPSSFHSTPLLISTLSPLLLTLIHLLNYHTDFPSPLIDPHAGIRGSVFLANDGDGKT